MSTGRYPVYVISKGRHDCCHTAKFLERDKVDFKLVVEPQEAGAYAKVYGEEKLLVLPFSNLGQGSIPARNWVWEHSIKGKHVRHWILDDNIRGVWRRFNGWKYPCEAGPAFRACEDFADRYENVAVAGLNYHMFAVNGQKMPPFYLNVHVYSFILIKNDLRNRWRGRYNEDTDLCLQVLADGWCTVLFNAFLAWKEQTGKMKGGNADELYKGDGRLKMSRSLERAWPYVVETKRRFQRPQHVVRDAWRKFDTPLKLKKGVDLSKLEPTSEYGFELEQVKSDVKSEMIRRMLKKDKTGSSGKVSAKAATPPSAVLDEPPTKALKGFLALCSAAGVEDVASVGKVAKATVKYLSGGSAARRRLRVGQALERRWYESLKRGAPDYAVYDTDYYLGELWACWVVYSRKYLREVTKTRSLPPSGVASSLGKVSAVVDLGCGFGYTTAALAEIFSGAKVVGTNIDGTVQAKLAKLVGRRKGFELASGPEDVNLTADLVFASEYFEHVPAPVDHLADVIRSLKPRAMLVANAFGTRAIGHFDEYDVRGATVQAKDVSKMFDREMRRSGYSKVKTKMWNNRPTFWKRTR
jgi:SAM-dependent methyltransferase